jgi:hypothetical protein
MSESFTISKRIVLLCLVLTGLNIVVLLSVSFAVFGLTREIGAVSRANLPPGDFPDAPPHANIRIPGVTRPRLCPPDQVDLARDELVIGVEVNGQPRAYLVKAFEVDDVASVRDLSAHIVNDIVGESPVSITHCNRTHSTRVFTYPPGAGVPGEPMDVCVGGWNDGMVVVVGNSAYPQHAEEIPLVDLPFLTTTWSRWQAEHPDSLVYTGDPCS